MSPAPERSALPVLLLFLLVAPLVFQPSNLTAQEGQDVEGAEDHPLVSRYEGSYILGHEQVDYDRLVLPVGPDEGEETETIAPEGEVTRILYAAPRGLSSLQVQRNYQMALANAGFEAVYECMDDCRDLVYRIYATEGKRIWDRDDLSTQALSWDWTEDARYLVAELPGSHGSTSVSVYTALHTAEGPEELHDRPITLVQIVQEKPMPTGKVTANVNAAAMAEDLNEAGTVRIYGIHFDTDQATIKPESEPTLTEIATLLESDPELSPAVVGHTDARGSLEHNMELSRQRAEAVVEYLITEEGISADRLEAHGVGYLAPVATNETEDGRARNRRVELIKLP